MMTRIVNLFFEVGYLNGCRDWIRTSDLQEQFQIGYDLPMTKLKNPKAIGEYTESVILSKLLSAGYAISIPFGNNQRYDMILDDGEKLIKAQCKTGSTIDGCVSFATCSRSTTTGERKSYHGEVDVFLVFCHETQNLYQVPVGITPNTLMRLRVDAPSAKSPKTTINWAKDFEMEI